jgi:phenylalanyl-tRNA synthetase alpha chain
MQDLLTLKHQALAEINAAADLNNLEQLRVDYLGKKGKLTDILKNVASLPAADKPKVGQIINEVKSAIVDLLESRTTSLKESLLKEKLQAEFIDVTLPGTNRQVGALHPLRQMQDRIISYFATLGFDNASGPEIETDYYNFAALNIPEFHPARAMQDTFYFADGRLLRTHTSTVQIRAMLEQEPPVRLIAAGRVYRNESDMTHTPMFHQVEGLFIDKTANMAMLKTVLEDFFTYIFEKSLKIRFRSSYFPFTEPSAEIDLQCSTCHGSGCRTCKFTGWLEIGGCGMVHPKVLANMQVDSTIYQGWAFGMGIDRITMLYYGIDDLRMLFENDLMFLSQF